MCNYYSFKLIPKKCRATPKHLVEQRTYERCARPRNIGTYRHCADEYATQRGAFGSTMRDMNCPVCDPGASITVASITGATTGASTGIITGASNTGANNKIIVSVSRIHNKFAMH